MMHIVNKNHLSYIAKAFYIKLFLLFFLTFVIRYAKFNNEYELFNYLKHRLKLVFLPLFLIHNIKFIKYDAHCG
ncbi:hypothetical protein Deia_00495 [Candidatus Deianiraea vastatrix]|uniref:Uncharacterized protein n=1 Tax=Candidatus Deianiraea vastatrix TaxID=2163644 RepID=A0A5B8XD86_9RICK|nr:hypothetical protein Deia_00495 [Candidatus Deianiraea vastatrix]